MEGGSGSSGDLNIAVVPPIEARDAETDVDSDNSEADDDHGRTAANFHNLPCRLLRSRAVVTVHAEADESAGEGARIVSDVVSTTSVSSRTGASWSRHSCSGTARSFPMCSGSIRPLSLIHI